MTKYLVFSLLSLSALVVCTSCTSSNVLIDNDEVAIHTRYNTLRDAVHARGSLMVRGDYVFRTTSTMGLGFKEQILFARDGAIIGTLKEAESIVDFQTIRSMNVLGGSRACALYGDRGVHGIVELITM